MATLMCCTSVLVKSFTYLSYQLSHNTIKATICDQCTALLPLTACFESVMM